MCGVEAVPLLPNSAAAHGLFLPYLLSMAWQVESGYKCTALLLEKPPAIFVNTTKTDQPTTPYHSHSLPKNMAVPYHEPEVIREAALQYITEVEEGASFPLLATGSLILGPELRYEKWSLFLEEEAQKQARDLRGPDKWDRNTHLLMELTRTLTADPLLWRDAGGMPTTTLVLDPRHLQSRSASLFGRNRESPRNATLEEVRTVVGEVPVIRLEDLNEWPRGNDVETDYPVLPWAYSRALRFYYYDQVEQFDKQSSGGQASNAIWSALSKMTGVDQSGGDGDSQDQTPGRPSQDEHGQPCVDVSGPVGGCREAEGGSDGGFQA